MKSPKSKLVMGTLAPLALCVMIGQPAYAVSSSETGRYGPDDKVVAEGTISEARAGAVSATRETQRQARDVMKDPQSADDNILELISYARAEAVNATREAQRQAREALNKTRGPGR